MDREKGYDDKKEKVSWDDVLRGKWGNETRRKTKLV